MLVEQGKILPQRLGEFGLPSEEQAILRSYQNAGGLWDLPFGGRIKVNPFQVRTATAYYITIVTGNGSSARTNGRRFRYCRSSKTSFPFGSKSTHVHPVYCSNPGL